MRAPAGDEAGFTLLEMLVATSIFVIVLTLILPTMSVLTKSSNSTDAITATDTTLRSALIQLTSQLTSAGTITSLCASNTSNRLPACQTSASGNTSGFGLVIYEDTAGDTLTGFGSSAASTSGTCFEWQVYNNTLQYRTWPSASTPPASFTLISPSVSISNTSGAGSAWQPPFTVAGNLVNLSFYGSGGSNTAAGLLQTSVNQQGGAPGTCSAGTGGAW
jgi:prepilin-type N-terminal cleavage/methylation domain-containing protein